MYEEEKELDQGNQKFLTFTLGDEIYGIDIKDVTEIISMQSLTQVPELPDYMKGIINLRGKIIPVLDVRLRFKKDSIPYDDRTCIIVINTADVSVGLIVDNVDEVLDILDDNIVPPPSSKTGFENKYISGIGKCGDKVVILLDSNKLFKEDELADISIIKEDN